MRTLTRLWPSLECVETSTVGSDWQMLLGPEFGCTWRHFSPQQQFSLTYHPPETAHPAYHVKIHSPGHIVGVCDETGEEINLSAADVTLYELNRPVFCRAIAQALGMEPDASPIQTPPSTDCLGHYLPVVGHRFPAYLSICCRARDFRQVVDRLAATRNGNPFLLLAPTRRYFSSVVQTVIRQSSAGLVALDDALALDEKSEFVATPAATAALKEFAETAISADEASSPEPRTNEFRRAGETWSICFAGKTFGLPDYLGLGYLAQLIAHPHEQMFCARLFAVVNQARPRVAIGSCGPDLDAAAVAAYRQEIAELQAELERNRLFNDAGRQEILQAELDHLIRALAAAVGLGGRSREHSDADRFRKSVSAAIWRAVDAIEAQDAVLGRHFRMSIVTGQFCCYSPERPIDWLV
jgi:hypothetical protein